MPRGPRQIELNGVYHVISRGIDGRDIFRKEQDFSRFTIGLELYNSPEPANLWPLLARSSRVGTDPTIVAERLRALRSRQQKRRPLVELLSFALMPNHYHLLIKEIVRGGVSFFMKKMGGYSVYFNKQYERIGPLFQSRFKTVPIQSDEQLMTAFVYVHTNSIELKEPLWKEFKVKDRARALRFLEEYPWSSYHDYVGRPRFPFVTNRDFFLEFFGSAAGCQKAVEDWVSFKAENAQLDLSQWE